MDVALRWTGDYSFDFYMETKNICLAHGTHRVPRLGV